MLTPDTHISESNPIPTTDNLQYNIRTMFMPTRHEMFTAIFPICTQKSTDHKDTYVSPDIKTLMFSLRCGPLQATRYGHYAMNQPNKNVMIATRDIKHG